MLTMCWAVKGGSGTTVVSCALGLLTARMHGASWLVDLAGDVPAALGITEPNGPGVHDWVTSTSAPPAAIEALGAAGADGLRVVPRGSGHARPEHERWRPLAEHLATSSQPWIVDAGTGSVPDALAEVAQQRLLIIRPCYLALRRAAASPIRPTGVVVVREPGRALSAGDVAATVGVPVIAEIALDPVVARAIDAGLLAARLPRPLVGSLRAFAS